MDVRDDLLPTPRHLECAADDLALGKRVLLRHDPGADQRDLDTLRDFADDMKGIHGVGVDVRPAGVTPPEVRAIRAGRDPALLRSPGLRGLPDPGSSGQGYRLAVDAAGAVIHGGGAPGLFYALQTLKQLVTPRGDGTPAIRGCRIADAPHYALRAFMFDAGRAPHPPGLMRRIIRIGSAFKLNAVVFREGDDELNAVRYGTVPLGRDNPEALTMRDMAELVAYAARRHMQLIPEIESLGHAGGKGRAYPHLVRGGLRESYPGIGVHVRKQVLDIANPETYRLLDALYREWAAILPGGYVHLGLDEVTHAFDGYTREDEREHLRRILGLLESAASSSGRPLRAIVWDDTAATPDGFAPRVVRCPWVYDEADVPAHAASFDLARLLGPGAAEPVLMAGGSGSGHTARSKAPYEGAFANLHAWARLGRASPNVLGLLAVQWSGNMQDDWLPDDLAAAEYGWAAPEEPRPFAELMQRIRTRLGRLPDAARPDPAEVARPAWDGIWLKDGAFERDILAGVL